jgi:hypothetical protein
MKKKLLSFVLILGVTSNAWSQQTCPLTNVKLTDLRVAAGRLLKNINLSAECQAYANTVNQANTNLSGIITQIKNADDKKVVSDGTTAAVETNKPDNKALALGAITQLNTINSVFNDKRCGQQLAGFLDYADAFTDVVVGMAPYLALYGGAAAGPWVLGPAIGGAAAKAIISFFKNRQIKMNDPDQSNAFIKNSCSFYNLNVIKNSIDEVQLHQTPRVEKEYLSAKVKLAEMVKNPFPKPSNTVAKTLSLAEKDQTQLKYLQDQMKVDPVEGCSYIMAFVSESDKNKDGSMMERVWNNYEKLTEASFKLDLEKRYFEHDLKEVLNTDPTKCSSLGPKWVNKMIVFNDSSLVSLRKAADEDKQVKDYRAWQVRKEEQELLVKALEAKLNYFREMTGSGFNIEYSEIIRSHDLIQDTIFDSYRFMRFLKTKGSLAEEWLKMKYTNAAASNKEFSSRKKEVEDRIQDISKTMELPSPKGIDRKSVSNFVTDYTSKNNAENSVVTKSVLVDVCTQLRNTWASWYNGLVFARAGRDYCVAFDNVINKLDYPDVQTLCFGTNDKNGNKWNSLKNQVEAINLRKSEADQISAYMDQFGCRSVDEADGELLKLPI